MVHADTYFSFYKDSVYKNKEAKICQNLVIVLYINNNNIAQAHFSNGSWNLWNLFVIILYSGHWRPLTLMFF